MQEEGYIKYDLHWHPANPLPDKIVQGLIDWRRRLYRLGLIGYDIDQEVGYGNISIGKYKGNNPIRLF